MTLKLVHPSQRTDPPSKAHCLRPTNAYCTHMCCPAHHSAAYTKYMAKHRADVS